MAQLRWPTEVSSFPMSNLKLLKENRFSFLENVLEAPPATEVQDLKENERQQCPAVEQEQMKEKRTNNDFMEASQFFLGRQLMFSYMET